MERASSSLVTVRTFFSSLANPQENMLLTRNQTTKCFLSFEFSCKETIHFRLQLLEREKVFKRTSEGRIFISLPALTLTPWVEVEHASSWNFMTGIPNEKKENGERKKRSRKRKKSSNRKWANSNRSDTIPITCLSFTAVSWGCVVSIPALKTPIDTLQSLWQVSQVGRDEERKVICFPVSSPFSLILCCCCRSPREMTLSFIFSSHPSFSGRGKSRDEDTYCASERERRTTREQKESR